MTAAQPYARLLSPGRIGTLEVRNRILLAPMGTNLEATDGTPGERPLVRSEVERVRRHLEGFRIRHYLFLGRLDRFVLDGYNYERTPPLRRGLMNALELVDYALLSLPRLRELGGACVMYGRPAKARVA